MIHPGAKLSKNWMRTLINATAIAIVLTTSHLRIAQEATTHATGIEKLSHTADQSTRIEVEAALERSNSRERALSQLQIDATEVSAATTRFALTDRQEPLVCSLVSAASSREVGGRNLRLLKDHFGKDLFSQIGGSRQRVLGNIRRVSSMQIPRTRSHPGA